MCHLAWRWNKALNDCIRLFSSSLWCYRPRLVGDCPPGCTKSSFNTLLAIILCSCCYRWWWKWLKRFPSFCKTWNVILLGLRLNSMCEYTNAAWNVTLWDCWLNLKFWHRRHDRCTLTSHNAQNKSLLAQLQPMRLLAGCAKNHHTDLHYYEQSSWIIRQKDRILQVIHENKLGECETL